MHLPAAIASLVEGAVAQRVDIGKSTAQVFRLTMPDRRLLFLKHAPPVGELSLEAQRLRWLRGKVSVPEVVAFACGDGDEYLLTTALVGVNGADAAPHRPDEVCRALAHALKQLHRSDANGCPFDHTVDAMIERARRRTHAGLVAEADFDEERLGRTATDLLVELDATRPADEARALTHGDACLPNVIVDGARFSGFVDCGRAGIADPYQDLALAARSIDDNLGAGRSEVFFREYGLPNPDRAKLVFYRLLDEFF